MDTAIFSLIGANSFTFSIAAGCQLIAPNSISDSIEILGIAFNNTITTSTSLFTNNFNITSSFLSINSTSGYVNQVLNNVASLQGYTRKFIIVNTGSAPFTGAFSFTTSAGSDLTLVNFGIESPALSPTISFNGSTGVINANISNFAVGDSILLFDSVFVETCTESHINTGKSTYGFSYGCDVSNLCQSLLIENTTISSTDVKPTITFTQLHGDTSCFLGTDTVNYSFIIVNEGNITAENFNLNFIWSGPSNTMLLDINNIEIKRTNDGLSLARSNLTTFSFCAVDSAIRSGDYTLGLFNPNDTIIVNYKAFNCCDIPLDRVVLRSPIINLSSDNPCSFNKYTYIGHRIDILTKLDQTFENFIAVLQPPRNPTDPPLIESFEINNDFGNFSTVALATTSHSYFNIDNMSFEIELSLDAGFILIDSTLKIQSNNDAPFPFTWEACQLTKMLGNNPNAGGGDVIMATFCLPTIFKHLKTSGTLRSLDSLNLFLGNSKVMFDLQAICPAAEPTSFITQKLFFSPDTNCASGCKILISEVATNVSILCPGCLIPGYIAGEFTLERANVGRQDDDNNRWPDDANNIIRASNLANLKRVVVGDTLKAAVSAHLWDGQEVHITDLPFDFKSTIIRMILPSNFEFIDTLIVVIFDTSAVRSDTIRIAATELIQNSGSTDLFLHVDSLHPLGLNPTFTHFDEQDAVTLCGNILINNNIANEVEFFDVNVKFNATGLEQYAPTQDANDVFNPCFNTDSLKVDSCAALLDSTMLFWCEGTAARVGQYRTNFTPLNFRKLGKGNGGINETGCSQIYWVESIFNIGGINKHNVFDFEFRDLVEVDTFRIDHPHAYQLDSVYVDRFFFVKENGVEVKKRIRVNFVNIYQDIDGYFVLPEEFVQDTTMFSGVGQNHTLPKLLNGEEDPIYGIYYMFTPEDCEMAFDTIVPLTTAITYAKLPGENPSIKFKRTIDPSLNASIQLQLSRLDLSVTPLSSDTVVQSDTTVIWEVRMVNNLDGVPLHPNTNQPYNRWGENTFLSIISPSGNITINDVTDNNGVSFTQINGIYQIDERLDISEQHDIQIVASFNCPNGSTAIDSILVIDGWHCYGFPTSLDSVCHSDTLVLYLKPSTTNLQVTLQVADTVTVCDTINYNFDIQAVGVGKIFDILTTINLPSNASLSYITGSGVVNFPYNTTTSSGTPFPLEPDGNLTFTLDSILLLKNRGFFFDNTDSTNIHINFSLLAACGYNGEAVSVNVEATSYCGETLTVPSSGVSPQTVLGLPDLDSLSLSITTTDLTSCGDSSLVSVTITNTGIKITGALNTLVLNLPTPFSYLSGNPFASQVGQNINFNLSAGINIGGTETISFYVQNDTLVNCGAFNLLGNIFVSEQYMCDTMLCTIDPISIVVDSSIINVVKADIDIANVNFTQFCSDSVNTIVTTLTNTTNITGEDIVLSYYCIENTTGPLTTPCLLETTTIPTINGNSTINVLSNLAASCPDCVTLIAVVEANCICSTDTSVTIVFPEPRSIQLDSLINVGCFGDSTGSVTASVQGGLGSFIINWSTGQTGVTINNLTAGNYWVAINDSTGCTDTLFFNINEPNQLVINATSTDVDCLIGNDGTITINVSGGTPPYRFSSDGGSSFITGTSPFIFTNLIDSTYQIVVSDSNNCETDTTITIVIDFGDCCFASLPTSGYFDVVDYLLDPLSLHFSPTLEVGVDFVLPNKSYIKENITIINNTTLDVTNVDLVFAKNVGITFKNSAILNSTNATYRPCFSGNSWGGLSFNDSSLCLLNEAVLKSAQKAIYTSSVLDFEIFNNEFLNDSLSIHIINGREHQITGNTFVINNNHPFVSNIEFTGITLSDINMINGSIAQNDFVSNNNVAHFFGISIQGSATEIIDNKFTNMYRAIDVGSSSSRILIENNEITIPTNFNNEIHQIRISDSKNILVFNNEIVKSDIATTGFDFNDNAIYVENCSGVNLKQNLIKGFNVGITAITTLNLNIGENEINNTGFLGIYTRNVSTTRISCNTINMKFNTLNLGIYFLQTTPQGKNTITSNCISESSYAILLQTLSGSSNLPLITNNYLFNYRFWGIGNFGFTGAIGTSVNNFVNSGHNSFIGNNGNNQVDIFSNPTIIARGNFGIGNVVGVNVAGKNKFSSVATCGNQVGNQNNNSQLLSQDQCDQYVRLFLELFLVQTGNSSYILANNYKTALANIDNSERLKTAITIMNLLEDNTELTVFQNEIIQSAMLSVNENKWLTYYYYSIKEDWTNAYTALLSISPQQVNEIDLLFVEKTKTEMVMQGNDYSQLTSGTINQLIDIDNRRQNAAPMARDRANASKL